MPPVRATPGQAGIALVVVIGLGLVVAAMMAGHGAAPSRGPARQAIATDDAVEGSTTEFAAQATAGPRRRVRGVVVDWLDGGGTHADHSAPNEARPAYRGQLVSRVGLQPLAHLPLRLSPAWLDRALPPSGEDTAGGRDGDPTLLEWRGTTNALGYFEIPFVAERRDLLLVIDGDGPWQDLVALAHAAWEGQTVELGTIALEPRGALRGTVHRAGRLLARVRVVAYDAALQLGPATEGALDAVTAGAEGITHRRRLLTAAGVARTPAWLLRRSAVTPFPRGETDARGFFALPFVRAGAVRLLLQTEDGTDLWRDVVVHAGGERVLDVDVGVDTEASAAVTFFDASGVPVDVDVVLAGGEQRVLQTDVPTAVAPPRRTVNSTVYLSSSGLERSEGLLSVRRHSDWPWELVRARPAKSGFHAELRELSKLTVIVTGVGGEVPRDLAVRLLPPDPEPDAGPRKPALGVQVPGLPAALQPREQRPGKFVADGLPPAMVRVLVTAPGYAPALLNTGAWGSERVELLPQFTMDVLVVDAAGAAVEGARVRAVPRDGKDDGQRLWSRLSRDPVTLGRTAEDGVLSVFGFWDNGFSLHAEHERGYGYCEVHRARPDGRVVIRLQRHNRLLVQLLDGEAPPAERLEVRAVPGGRIREHHRDNAMLGSVQVRADDHGRCELRDLVVGKWRLEVRYAGERRPVVTDSVDVQAGLQLLDLQLRDRTGSVVRGSVTVDGAVPRDVVVELERLPPSPPKRLRPYFEQEPPARWAEYLDRKGWEKTVRRATLSPQGTFELPVDRGRCALRVVRNRHGVGEVLAEARYDKDVESHSFEIVTGTLLAQLVGNRGPLARCAVIVEHAEHQGVRYDLSSDARGEVELRDLPAGNYRLTAMVHGQRRSGEIVLRAGARQGARVQMR